MKEMAEAKTQPVQPVEMQAVTAKPKKSNLAIILIVVAIVVSGGVTGYLLSGGKMTEKPVSLEETGEKIAKGMVFGLDNPAVYRDTAEGLLEVNDSSLVEEGTHKLVREGGESQTVYLTSTVLDLGKLAGHRVKVWGETFAAQKAGWLMDVGKVEILE